jgi:hypothetical protein
MFSKENVGNLSYALKKESDMVFEYGRMFACDTCSDTCPCASSAGLIQNSEVGNV